MKLICTILLFMFVQCVNGQLPAADVIKTSNGDITIQPIFHSAIVINWQQTTIYVDPYNGKEAFVGQPSPDFILITHVHQDHLDTLTLNELNTSKAKLIVPQAVADKLPLKWRSKLIVLNNNETYKNSEFSLTAIPMYDMPQEPNSRHIKTMGNGYVIDIAGKRIYISGDTDDIPEMRKLENIDIAFVCMNQPYTMTIKQAASATLEFNPKIIYPYHYRDKEGFTDIEAFKKLVEEGNNSIDVRNRNWYSEILPAKKPKKSETVIYGMVSGTSLTMDIYKPEISNKIGIVAIPGTAFGYAYTDGYDQLSMTENFDADSTYFGIFAKELVKKGFTVFVPNHRLAPRYKYNDIISDCQRAVRYIRHNSKKHNIDSTNIGAFGFSSGATLCSMLGVMEKDQKSADLNKVSSKVQAVVTLAARFDLCDFNKKMDTLIQNPIISRVLLNYIGELPAVENGNYILDGKYAEASPITYVDKSDASFLIYCSIDDPLVPYRQATNMYKKLRENGVDAKIKTTTNEGHNPIPNIEEMEQWFLRILKK